jgi:hypothetical protein
LYLLFFTAAALALFGIIYSWIFFAAFILTIITTVLFVLDIENEADINRTPFEDVMSELDEVTDAVSQIGGFDE